MIYKPVSRGVRNNNPFNLIKSLIRWKGKIESTDPDFDQFDNLELGIRAGLVNLKNGYFSKGYNTAELIIDHYAPTGSGIYGNSIESNEAYKRFIAQSVYGTNDIDIDLTGNELLVAHAIMVFENGSSPVSMEELQEINTKYKIF